MSGSTSAQPTIAEIELADDPESWEALGFLATEGTVQLGATRIATMGRSAGVGILSWSLREAASLDLDGLPTKASRTSSTPAKTVVHPNGITAIDHVVAMSPDLDRSIQALRAAGLDLRRVRDQPTPAGAPRQAFFRLGQVILEVVQEPHEVLAARPEGAGEPARLWGLALLSEDLELTVERLGGNVSEIRAAVQPGRRIATVRRSAGLAVPIALMSTTEN